MLPPEFVELLTTLPESTLVALLGQAGLARDNETLEAVRREIARRLKRQPMDIVRVLRIVEYVGPREAIEKQVANSIHGSRTYPTRFGEVTIRAATIGEYPEILDRAVRPEELPNDGDQ